MLACSCFPSGIVTISFRFSTSSFGFQEQHLENETFAENEKSDSAAVPASNAFSQTKNHILKGFRSSAVDSDSDEEEEEQAIGFADLAELAEDADGGGESGSGLVCQQTGLFISTGTSVIDSDAV